METIQQREERLARLIRERRERQRHHTPTPDDIAELEAALKAASPEALAKALEVVRRLDAGVPLRVALDATRGK